MSSFIQALESKDLNAVISFPKSDLHNHSALGSRRDLLNQVSKVPIPAAKKKMTSIQELNEYIFGFFKHILEKEELLKVIKTTFQSAQQDGVSLLEMSIDAGFIQYLDKGADDLVEIMKQAHNTVAPDIDFRPQIGFARTLPVESSIDMMKTLVDTGYFYSIDMYDDELHGHIKDYKPIYSYAKSKGLKCRAHVGEFGNAESIREAVEALELDAVQHGIAAATSKEVMTWLSYHHIQLNVCPSSNVHLSRVSNYKTHPIKILYDNSVPVTINSDDLVIFDQSVSEEYLNLYNSGLLSASELDEIRQFGLESNL